MAFVYEQERKTGIATSPMSIEEVGPGYVSPEKYQGFNAIASNSNIDVIPGYEKVGGTSPFKSKVNREKQSFFNPSQNQKIGPGSYFESDNKVLPIKDNNYYYVVEGGKLKEKVQPFAKNERKLKLFKIQPTPAPGQYHSQSSNMRSYKNSRPQLSSTKKKEIRDTIGPGYYDPEPNNIIKRNDLSVLKWNTYEKRTGSIMKDIEQLEEQAEEFPCNYIYFIL